MIDAADHFRGTAKMIEIGKGGKRQIEDVELTRYGCTPAAVARAFGHRLVDLCAASR